MCDMTVGHVTRQALDQCGNASVGPHLYPVLRHLKYN